MSWKVLIPGTFGIKDNRFARHANDAERASELLMAAINAKVSSQDYFNGIEDWMRAKGCSAQHISEEMLRIKDVKSYLL
jgi:hypothetical protein